MILQALQTKINAVINAYPMIGDIDAEIPFAVYGADQSILRSKRGVEGYEYTVRIAVVSDNINECMTKSGLIRTAVEALTGKTQDSTKFDFVIKDQEVQRFDVSTNRYINDLTYRIITTNE